MSGRAQAVLERFPTHLAATDPEKRFEYVVTGLVDALEVLTRQLADVRRAHRLGEAPTTIDLESLAALHGLSSHAFDVLARRLTVIEAAAAAASIDRRALASLMGLVEGQLADLTENELANQASEPSHYRPSLELRRRVVRGVIAAHTVGNATATSLLTAAAAYLGLEAEHVAHTEERWWHLATCHDLIRIDTEREPAPDILALEENPFRTADIKPSGKKHGQAFQVVRGGIDDVTVTIRVIGIGGRTVRPMVVECHAGQGVVFEGSVADGSELRLEASGRATLDGADVTGSAWAFRGAVFGSSTEKRNSHDFVFAGRPLDGDRQATFVVTMPLADATSATSAFPHGAATITPMGLPRGLSRWVPFVRPGHASGPSGSPPRHKLGRFDASVFAETDGAAGVTAGEAVMNLGFEWEEREPFSLRILLPERFLAFDDDKGSLVRAPLRQLLDRHRAAGVDVRVEYADPRWTLGKGLVRDQVDDALGTVIAGTELWPDGSPQPGSG